MESLVVCVVSWDVGTGWVGSHAWCNLFRVDSAKFKTGMCEMNIFGLKFVVCPGTLIQDGLAHLRGVTFSGRVQDRCVR